MAVRAKFKYIGYESNLYNRQIDPAKGYAEDNMEQVEMRSLKFSPVAAGNDPNHENYKFWATSPSGSLTLGTINPAAYSQFKLGKEYYLDFTEAE